MSHAGRKFNRPQKPKMKCKQPYNEQIQQTDVNIYSSAHKFTHPLQNILDINNFNKIRGIIKSV